MIWGTIPIAVPRTIFVKGLLREPVPCSAEITRLYGNSQRSKSSPLDSKLLPLEVGFRDLGFGF